MEQPKNIIAQDDDCDYYESGWVAWVDGDRAYLARYSHCSCYGTWGYDGAVESADWDGTVDELVTMAAQKLDPAMPSRQTCPEDYDYDHLMLVYEQIGKWDAGGRVLPCPT